MNLYSAIDSGLIMPGFLLSGIIASLDVKPYKIGSEIVYRYTKPIIWDNVNPSDKQKEILTRRIFAANGKILIDKNEDHKTINHLVYDTNSPEYNTVYEEYGGPSDGYGGYLDDDFINDALDGDVDAYWNLD